MVAINKENSIAVLIHLVRAGQKTGTFLLKDAKLIKQAIDYFNPDVTEKPTFENADNPEIVAVNILLQSVQKAQAKGGENAYSIEDAALLWDIMEFWIKEGSKAGAQAVQVPAKEPEGSSSSKKKRHADKATVAESEEEDNLISIAPAKNKGKAREV